MLWVAGSSPAGALRRRSRWGDHAVSPWRGLLNRSLDELRAVDPAGWSGGAANLGTRARVWCPDRWPAPRAAAHAAGWLMDVYLLRRHL
jgi:hypothetical protein